MFVKYSVFIIYMYVFTKRHAHRDVYLFNSDSYFSTF